MEKIEDQSDEKIIDANYDDVSGLELDNDDELATILAEIDADVEDVHYSMQVYRVPKIGKLIWLFDCDPTEPVKAKLRDEYGDGKYELRVRRSYQGSNSIFRRPKIRIETPRYPGRPNTDGSTAARHDDDLDIASIMEQSNNRLIKMLEALLPRAQPVTTPNQFDQMGAMLTMMTQVKEFTHVPTSKKTSTLETMNEFLELKKIFSGGENESNDSDVIVAAIEHIGAPLSKITEDIAKRKSIKAANRPPEAAKKKTKKKSTKKIKENEDMLGMRMGIHLLVGAAARNDDPAPYVDIIFERLSPENITTFLTNPDAMDLLVEINPKAGQHPKWFGEMSVLLNKKLEELSEIDS